MVENSSDDNPLKPKVPRISLKDHKPDYITKPMVRLINPSKTDLGRISKAILDRVLPRLRNLIRLEQWRNTDKVIDWFNSA